MLQPLRTRTLRLDLCDGMLRGQYVHDPVSLRWMVVTPISLCVVRSACKLVSTCVYVANFTACEHFWQPIDTYLARSVFGSCLPSIPQISQMWQRRLFRNVSNKMALQQNQQNRGEEERLKATDRLISMLRVWRCAQRQPDTQRLHDVHFLEDHFVIIQWGSNHVSESFWI